MSELKTGDKVRVSYTGVVVSVRGPDTYVKDVAGSQHRYQRGADVQLDRLSPAHWPPQLGDMWKADGRLYFIRNSAAFGLLARDAQANDHMAVRKLAELRPELCYRRYGQGTTGA